MNLNKNVKSPFQKRLSIKPITNLSALSNCLTNSSVRMVRKIIKNTVGQRMTIRRRPEAGTRIYRRFHRRAAHECVTPVLVPAADLSHIPEAVSVWEKILPDSLSYIPKKAGYYTERGFHARGFPDARAQGWEEFMWNDRPFAFHMRAGTHKMEENPQEKMAQLYRILAGFGEGIIVPGAVPSYDNQK